MCNEKGCKKQPAFNKKSKNKEWTDRLNTLEQHIQYWIENTTNKTIETIQLFYD